MQKGSPREAGQILIWIIVGTLIMIIAGGTYYLGRSISPKPSATPTVISPASTQRGKQTPQPTPSPAPSDASPVPNGTGETTNWKTYTNTKYRYSLSYPKDWLIKSENIPGDTVTTETQIQSKDFIVAEPSMGGGFIPGAEKGMKLQIIVSQNPNFKSYEEFKNAEETKSTEFPLNYFSSTKITKIAGIEAVEKLDGKPYGGKQYYAYTFNNGTIYKIYLTSSDNQQILFELILSTFRFD